MTRSPLRTRPTKHNDNEDAGRASSSPEREKMKLSQRLLQPVQPLGRPYDGEEEKQQVYTDLIRLKSAGKTNRECADMLGVSARTIDNYRADPLYAEIEGEMESDAKQRGFTTIAELIQDALDVVYDILQHEKSGFVRFKAAELLLNYAGYNTPRETREQSNRDEANKFLAELKERRQQQQQHIQVNVQVNQVPHGSGGGTIPGETTVVEAVEVVEGQEEEKKGQNLLPGTTEKVGEIPPELLQYYAPIQPGGKLPEGFK